MSKVVIANYCVNEAYKIPKGVDLEDKTVVSSWGIKWSVLVIEFTNGKVLKIQPEWTVADADFKRPSEDPTIENAFEYGLEEECTDEARCEDCTHCARTKPCECGTCDVVGGTCEEQLKMYEEEEEAVVIGIFCSSCDNDLPPHTMSEHLDKTAKIHKCPHVWHDEAALQAWRRMEEKVRNLC
jgi:hypothetical protein